MAWGCVRLAVMDYRLNFFAREGEINGDLLIGDYPFVYVGKGRWWAGQGRLIVEIKSPLPP